MGRKKLPYGEGDWFSVPLEDGTYAVGLVARCPQGGKVLLGYFFGPKRAELPGAEDVTKLTKEDAVLVARFGDLGLHNKEWSVVGRSERWDRDAWPMPVFARTESTDSSKAYLTSYADDDPNRALCESVCDAKEAGCFPQDGVWGYGAIEMVLTDLLSA